jgi:hypothetical protein
MFLPMKIYRSSSVWMTREEFFTDAAHCMRLMQLNIIVGMRRSQCITTLSATVKNFKNSRQAIFQKKRLLFRLLLVFGTLASSTVELPENISMMTTSLWNTQLANHYQLRFPFDGFEWLFSIW